MISFPAARGGEARERVQSEALIVCVNFIMCCAFTVPCQLFLPPDAYPLTAMMLVGIIIVTTTTITIITTIITGRKVRKKRNDMKTVLGKQNIEDGIMKSTRKEKN